MAKDEKEYFHSMVAKLLYLAKRVRPDTLTAISFLATRVREPTEQDLAKRYKESVNTSDRRRRKVSY